MRRSVFQVTVFLLLCIPLLSAVSFLVYTVIPNAHFVILHPLSLCIFLLLGVYGACVLHGWQRAARILYFIVILMIVGVGTISITAFAIGAVPPFLVHSVAVAPGASIALLAMLTLFVGNPKTRIGKGVLSFVVCGLIGYLLVAQYIAPYLGLALWHATLPAWNALLCACALVMILCTQETEKMVPRGIVRILLGIGVLGFVGTYMGVHIYMHRAQENYERMRAEQQEDIYVRAKDIALSYENAAKAIADQVTTAEPLTEDIWLQITETLSLTQYPALAVASYVPRVIDGDRQTFPIRYVASFVDGALSSPGFDISTDPVRNQVLQRAIGTGSVIATPRNPDTGMISLYAPTSGGIIALSLYEDVITQQIADTAHSYPETKVLVDTEAGLPGATVLLGEDTWSVSVISMQAPQTRDISRVYRIGYGSTVLLLAVITTLHILRSKRTHRQKKGVFTIRPIKTQLYPFLESMTKEYGAIFAKYKQYLEVAVPRRLPIVVVDPTLLRVVLETMLYNARSMSSIRGTIAVEVKVSTVRRVPQSIVITCADSGIGLSDSEQRALLQHEQLIVETTEGTTELEGLRTAVRMLKMVECEIAVWSEKGVGTTVTLTIPVPTQEPKAL